jgi:ABC-type branched-subunit amino acid transport system substrate-binding protein
MAIKQIDAKTLAGENPASASGARPRQRCRIWIAAAAAAWLQVLANAISAQESLRFGVADPLTGPSAIFGFDQMQAVRWAVEDINAKGA